MKFVKTIFAVLLIAVCTWSTTTVLAASPISATANTPATIGQQAPVNDQETPPTNAFNIHHQGETAVTLLEQLSKTQSIEDSRDYDGLGTSRPNRSLIYRNLPVTIWSDLRLKVTDSKNSFSLSTRTYNRRTIYFNDVSAHE
ncbi:MAG: hypothetical protein U5J63_09790 [Fodinibius sp.]|nr:hypothetical protein [Fodinibius sp.]